MKKIDSDEILNKIQKGDIATLSKAITLIESSNPKHQSQALDLLSKINTNKNNKTFRIGISGPPGVGKSTFIDTFGEILCAKGHKVCVLAVDPTSEISKGSILGDKTRMEKLSKNPNAFIRPSASLGSLGGVAKRTREAIILCEYAGFDVVLIETVGVGQSETLVKSMVDFFLLLVQAGSGDELQGVKKGIVEISDLLVITKDDGNNSKNVNISKSEFTNAIHYQSPINEFWNPKVLTCSAYEGKGLNEIWEKVLEFYSKANEKGFINKNRKKQDLIWFENSIFEELKNILFQNSKVKSQFDNASIEIKNGKLNPSVALEKIKNLIHQLILEN